MRPRALVTGAAIRVGRAIAEDLARDFDLVLHSRTSSLVPVEEACTRLGARVTTVYADLATVEGVEAVVAATRQGGQSLHLLVNNASLFSPVAFSEITLSQWQVMQDVNLRAPFLLSQRLLEDLSAADGALVGAPEGQHGVVVHICDIGADRPASGYVHYSVSKAALVMLVKAMAVELAPKIRTVGISPGQVVWPESYPEEKRARIRNRIPLKRVGEPKDIATAVRYLCCEAHYANGVIWAVDGGLSTRY